MTSNYLNTQTLKVYEFFAKKLCKLLLCSKELDKRKGDEDKQGIKLVLEEEVDEDEELGEVNGAVEVFPGGIAESFHAVVVAGDCQGKEDQKREEAGIDHRF